MWSARPFRLFSLLPGLMLLAVDVGNSRIKFGVFTDGRLVSKFSLPTRRDLTAVALADAAAVHLPDAVESAIVSSVVPEINTAIMNFVAERSETAGTLVTNDIDLGFKVEHHPIEDAGSDRLVNAFSAVEKYGAPCIVCSLGTALTIDVVSGDRILIGGLIAPGMGTLSRALHLSASRLPEVELVKPDRVVQQTTAGALQSGIVYGYLSLVDGLIARVKKEVGSEVTVIATGGLAGLVSENISQIDIVDDDLLLEGLERLHRRLRR